jgi:hypothetical protein
MPGPIDHFAGPEKAYPSAKISEKVRKGASLEAD